jgi:hypothetical protein
MDACQHYPGARVLDNSDGTKKDPGLLRGLFCIPMICLEHTVQISIELRRVKVAVELIAVERLGRLSNVSL